MGARPKARGRVSFSKREKRTCLLLGAAGPVSALVIFFVISLVSAFLRTGVLGSTVSTGVDAADALDQTLKASVLRARAHEADYAQQSLVKLNAVKDRIALLVIDDETLRDARFRAWPIARNRYAEMLTMLDKAGAKIVGLDILFLEPQPAFPGADEALKKALAASPRTVLAEMVTRDANGDVMVEEPLAMLTEGWSQEERRQRIGITYEGDEVVRSVPLVIPVGANDRLSFDALLAARMLDVPLDQIVDHSESGFVQIGPRSVPVEAGAMSVNFYWPGTVGAEVAKDDSQGTLISATQTLNYYPLSALWDMSDDDRAFYFKDRLVLVGVTAQAGHDLKITPFGKMAGVEVHANALLTILSEGYVSVMPILWRLAVTLLLCLLVGFMLPRLDPRIGVLAFLALEVAIIMGAFYLLSEANVWFPPATPMISLLLSFTMVTIYLVRAERRAKMLMKSLFEKATPVREEDVINFLLSGKTDADEFEPELEVRERTILFTDIRDYTVMSESMDAGEVMKTLNTYYSEMQVIINECGGKIWEYIGDAQMVVFGEKTNGRYPPECQVKPAYANLNPADQAVHAAIKMVERLEQLNAQAREQNRPVLQMGVGINSGPVSLGTIKNKGKLVFAAIGDAVNVAARMESMSKELGSRILLTERTFEQLEGAFPFDKVTNVRVKGKAEPMTVYRIFAGQQAREQGKAGKTP